MNKLFFALVLASVASGTNISCQEQTNREVSKEKIVTDSYNVKSNEKTATLSKTKKALITTACLALAGSSAAYFLPVKEYFDTLIQKVSLKDATTPEKVTKTERISNFFAKQTKK